MSNSCTNYKSYCCTYTHAHSNTDYDTHVKTNICTYDGTYNSQSNKSSFICPDYITNSNSIVYTDYGTHNEEPDVTPHTSTVVSTYQYSVKYANHFTNSITYTFSNYRSNTSNMRGS